MSTVHGLSALGGSPSSGLTDLTLEAVDIPVADVDCPKAFDAGLGWRLDADFSFDDGFRDVQLTSPGSQYSVQLRTHLTGVPPGSARAGSDHAEHEKRIGRADSDWPVWYAEYVVHQQSGQERPV